MAEDDVLPPQDPAPATVIIVREFVELEPAIDPVDEPDPAPAEVEPAEPVEDEPELELDGPGSLP